jgi:hypothetical protein
VVDSATQITAIAPPQAAATVDILVTTYSGTSSNTSSDNYTYNAATAPSISAISPSSGSAVGGTLVTITGSNFTGASGVTFGGDDAWYYTIVSDTTILAYAPAHAAATVDIQVTTPSGSSSNTSSDNYTYNSVSAPTLTTVSPTTGSGAGGTTVTLTGTNFGGAYAVYFGTEAATFVVNSSTQITATTPAHLAGAVDVTVLTAGGTTAVSTSTRYTFTAASAATVTDLATSSGTTAGGTKVVITGTNFYGVSGVTFGSVAATSFTVLSSTSIEAYSPPQAAATVHVRVTAVGGISTPSGDDEFTYSAASSPTINSLSPAR